jgi:hypothetical protein
MGEAIQYVPVSHHAYTSTASQLRALLRSLLQCSSEYISLVLF